MNKTKVIEKKVEASKKGRVCLRCPQLITAVANEGLDGILLASPKVRSCKTNLPYSSKLYQIETLFGQEMSIVLPQGRHKLQANIRNIETGLIVHSCILKYNVIVRRCKGYPNVKNKNLTLSCTAGTLWGSECVFSCKNKDEYLSHHEPMFCNENAEWVGKEPTCGPELGLFFFLIKSISHSFSFFLFEMKISIISQMKMYFICLKMFRMSQKLMEKVMNSVKNRIHQ